MNLCLDQSVKAFSFSAVGKVSMNKAESITNHSTRSRAKKSLSQVVISAMMLALAVVIKAIAELIPFSNLPYGGSITIILVPLVLAGLFCGPIWGTVVAIAFSGINFLWDGVMSWTPNTNAVIITLFLDYIVAFGVIGLSSLFRRSFFRKNPWAPLLAVLSTGLLRLVSHFFSGVIVWNQIWDYEGPVTMNWSVSGITYSLAYNCSYMIPTILLSMLVMLFLLRPLYITFNMPVVAVLKPKGLETTEGKEYKMPSYRLLSYAFAGIFLILGILASVPQLKMNWLGYFAGPLSLTLFGYELYLFIKGRKAKEPIDAINVIMLVVFLLLVALAVLGIISRFTYGASSYVVAE